MAHLKTKLGTVALLAIAAAFVTPGMVRAAGQFDGNWVLNASGAGGRMSQEGGAQVCSDFRLPFRIANNQISGTYARSPSTPTEIVASPRGTPMKGTVMPDGSFTMQWERYNVSGKITGNTLTATWTGVCGLRSATGTRVQ